MEILNQVKIRVITKIPTPIEYQHKHDFCVMCGNNNPWSLKLSFNRNSNGIVNTRLKTSSDIQGYSGIVHGGVIASFLDAGMTHCLFHQGIQAVTADLHVRYIKPIPCETLIDIHAYLTLSNSPLYCLKSEIFLHGELMAWGKGKFVFCEAGAS